MSLFGAASGFGTGGASMFGSAAADNHNPMKVPPKVSWVCRDTAGGPRCDSARNPDGLGASFGGENSEILSRLLSQILEKRNCVSPGRLSYSP